jgi:hypothetical protein
MRLLIRAAPLLQHLQALGCKLILEKCNAGRIAAGPAKTLD